MKKFISGLLIGLMVSACSVSVFAATQLSDIDYKEKAIERLESAGRAKNPMNIAIRNVSSISFSMLAVLEELEEQNDKLDQMITLLEEK